MFKFLSAAILSAALTLHCVAQNDLPQPKMFNQYIGFQANELVRQLVNLSNSNTNVNNPYLLVYSISCAKTGWGLHVGLGYTYSKSQDKDAPVGRESSTNDFFYRIGIEKKFWLGKKFEAGVALDFTASKQLDKTFSTSVTNLGSEVDSSISTVTNNTPSVGGGPQFSLGFHITDKIILATEAAMYYSSQKLKQNVFNIETVTQTFSGGTQTSTSTNFNSETDNYGFSFTVPVSLFLIVKF